MLYSNWPGGANVVGATVAYLALVEVTKDLFYCFAIRPVRTQSRQPGLLSIDD